MGLSGIAGFTIPLIPVGVKYIIPNPKSKKRRGPKPERLKLKGDWEALIGKALKKKRPKKGWGKGDK